VLIIGLVIVTQTVTLAAVLAEHPAERGGRARPEQLRSGGAFAEQLIRFRAGQAGQWRGRAGGGLRLSGGVASGDSPPSVSRPHNAQRIGADMRCCSIPHGRVLASTAPGAADSAGSPAGLLEGCFQACATSPTSGSLARIRISSSSRRCAPRDDAWSEWGSIADDALAQKIRDLVGSAGRIVTHGYEWGPAVRRDAAGRTARFRLSARRRLPGGERLSRITRLGMRTT